MFWEYMVLIKCKLLLPFKTNKQSMRLKTHCHEFPQAPPLHFRRTHPTVCATSCSSSGILFPEGVQLHCPGCLDALHGFNMCPFHGQCDFGGRAESCTGPDSVTKVDEDIVLCFYELPFCGMMLSSSSHQIFFSLSPGKEAQEGVQCCCRKQQQQ